MKAIMLSAVLDPVVATRKRCRAAAWKRVRHA